MTTKFILCGGFNKDDTNPDLSNFYTEILKDTPEKLKLLLVIFAKNDDRVEEVTARVIAGFNKIKLQKVITFEIANKNQFEDQIKSSDVIYFIGGSTQKLLSSLKEFPNLKNLLEGKTVAGESAGANVLCSYFYSPNSDKVDQGLGFLPIKIIPHYSKEYKNKLDNVGGNLDKLFLPEYQFKAFSL